MSVDVVTFCVYFFIFYAGIYPRADRKACKVYIKATLRKMNETGLALYVLGDFNVDYKIKLNWLQTILNKLNMHQIIEEYTRIVQTSKGMSKSILDLIITNNLPAIIKSEIDPPIADHWEVSCVVNYKRKQKTKIKINSRTHTN